MSLDNNHPQRSRYVFRPAGGKAVSRENSLSKFFQEASLEELEMYQRTSGPLPARAQARLDWLQSQRACGTGRDERVRATDRRLPNLSL